MTNGNVYVYAIVPAGTVLPADCAGVDDPPAVVRVVEEGPVAAVVSASPVKLRARRRDLIAHQELLTRLSEDGPVIPMRFGMVAPDEEAVRRQLSGSSATHLAVLHQLDGRVEVNVKVLTAPDALGALVEQDERVRGLREAARVRPGHEANLRLGEAVAAALAQRAAAAGRRVLDELSSLAHAVAAGPEVRGCELNASFLVGRDEYAVFRASAERLAAHWREHAELRVAGPLPCYSFVAAEGAPAPAEV